MIIRVILFILTSVIHVCICIGQSGEYCNEDFMRSSCYTFLSDNKFTSEELMCNIQIVGQGSFEKVNDSLFLHYEPIEFFTSQFKIRKTNDTLSSLKFNIIDYESKEPIDNIYMSLLNGEYVQINNRKEINLENIREDKSPLLIGVTAENYSSYRFAINEKGHYEVDLQLMKDVQREQYEAKSGLESFKVVSESEGSIVLRKDAFDLEFKK